MAVTFASTLPQLDCSRSCRHSLSAAGSLVDPADTAEIYVKENIFKIKRGAKF